MMYSSAASFFFHLTFAFVLNFGVFLERERVETETCCEGEITRVEKATSAKVWAQRRERESAKFRKCKRGKVRPKAPQRNREDQITRAQHWPQGANRVLSYPSLYAHVDSNPFPLPPSDVTYIVFIHPLNTCIKFAQDSLLGNIISAYTILRG
jgi:hypothetical protein